MILEAGPSATGRLPGEGTSMKTRGSILPICVVGFVTIALVIIALRNHDHRQEAIAPVRMADASDTQLFVLQLLMRQYYRDYGELPPRDRLIAGLLGENRGGIRYIAEETNWVRDNDMLDSFGRPILIEIEGTKVQLRSAGANGVLGYEDDYEQRFGVGEEK
jgi:hypothetical protein